MHIGFFIQAWPPAQCPSGIATYVQAMQSALTMKGHKVSIVTDLRDSSDPRAFPVGPESLLDIVRRRVGARFAPEYGEPFAYWRRILRGLERVHKQEPIDVFEIEETFGWGGMLQSHTTIPVVIKLHGPAFLTLTDEEKKSKFAQNRIAIESRSVTKAAAIMSPSAQTLESARKVYGLGSSVGYHVRNPLIVRDETPQWNVDTCDRSTLLFVGRFDNVKGADLLLKMFRHLLRERPHLKLLFAGPDFGLTREDGSREHMPEFMAREFAGHDASRVEYLGMQTREQIEQLRVRAAATLVTSRWENQCYTALEAQAQGCPVIAFDSGMREIIEHERTGRLAKLNSIEDYSMQVCAVLDNPAEAREMGLRGRAFVLDAHSADRVAEASLEVYAKVIGSTVR